MELYVRLFHKKKNTFHEHIWKNSTKTVPIWNIANLYCYHFRKIWTRRAAPDELNLPVMSATNSLGSQSWGAVIINGEMGTLRNADVSVERVDFLLQYPTFT